MNWRQLLQVLASGGLSLIAMGEDGKLLVGCENCGSANLDFDGWDIDKCRDCGHWRYR